MNLIPLQTARKQLAAYVEANFPSVHEAATHLGVPYHMLGDFLHQGGKPPVALQRALGARYVVHTEYFLETKGEELFLPAYTPVEYVDASTLRNLLGEMSVSHPRGVIGCARDLNISPSYLYSIRTTNRSISDSVASALGYKRLSNSGLGRNLYQKL